MSGISEVVKPVAAVLEPLEEPAAGNDRHGPSLLRALGAWDVSLITIGTIVGSARSNRSGVFCS